MIEYIQNCWKAFLHLFSILWDSVVLLFNGIVDVLSGLSDMLLGITRIIASIIAIGFPIFLISALFYNIIGVIKDAIENKKIDFKDWLYLPLVILIILVYLLFIYPVCLSMFFDFENICQ